MSGDLAYELALFELVEDPATGDTLHDAALTVLVTRGWVTPGRYPFRYPPPGGDLEYQQLLRDRQVRWETET